MGRHRLLVCVILLTACGQTFDAAPILQAIQPHVCEHPVCADPPHGCVAYVIKDKKECPLLCTYSCGAPWCAVRTCLEPCPGGYYKDKTGCHSCNCKPYCEDKLCLGDCPSGYEKDRQGCSTCICVPSPTSSAAPTTTVKRSQQLEWKWITSQTNSENSSLIGLGDCPSGYEKDRQGCSTCICVPSPTSSAAPTTTVKRSQQVEWKWITSQTNRENSSLIGLGDCPSGYEKDRQGCSTCICVPSPTSSAAPTTTVKRSQQVEWKWITSQTNSENSSLIGQQSATTPTPVCILDKSSNQPNM